MMFLESPSQLAPIEVWLQWAQRLETFNARDKTVIAEKLRAQEIIEILREEEALDHA